MKITQKPNSLSKITILIAIILIATAYLFYNNNQYGELKIEDADIDKLSMFIDNETKKIPHDLDFKIKQGKHSIILHQEGFWPWNKDLEIKAKEQIVIRPFFVPQNTSGILIGSEDSEYFSIKKLFKEKLINEEILNQINNSILKEKIKALDYYKNRNDVIVIAVEEGIYALEITQENLQPIYKGVNPIFVKKDNDTIYILDNNNLMLVNY